MTNLNRKITTSYMLLVILIVLLMAIISNYFIEVQFVNYISKNIDEQVKQTYNIIQEQYSQKSINLASIESIGVNALENGLIVKLYDINGNKIWDATDYNNGKCQAMIQHYSSNMLKRYPNFTGKYIENNFALTSDSKKIANLTIGYYGPFFYSDSEIEFLSSLNGAFIIIGILSIIIALIIGRLISNKISTPISYISYTTDNISKGKYEEILIETDTIEIEQLKQSINTLSHKLKQQDILRKNLTRDISHELRTPLTTLISHLEALIDGIWEATPERLESCLEEAKRLNELVDNVTNLSQYDFIQNLTISEFNISDLLKKILLNYEKLILDKNIHLSLDIENCFIEADKNKISQVINNLISNSMKFVRNYGKIKVTLKSNNDFIEMKFEDDGIGISEKDLPYIFERFYKAEKSRNSSVSGSGIGLSIVKSIVDMHNGKIAVESELNKGTIFTITLPKKQK